MTTNNPSSEIAHNPEKKTHMTAVLMIDQSDSSQRRRRRQSSSWLVCRNQLIFDDWSPKICRLARFVSKITSAFRSVSFSRVFCRRMESPRRLQVQFYCHLISIMFVLGEVSAQLLTQKSWKTSLKHVLTGFSFHRYFRTLERATRQRAREAPFVSITRCILTRAS